VRDRALVLQHEKGPLNNRGTLYIRYDGGLNGGLILMTARDMQEHRLQAGFTNYNAGHLKLSDGERARARA